MGCLLPDLCFWCTWYVSLTACGAAVVIALLSCSVGKRFHPLFVTEGGNSEKMCKCEIIIIVIAAVLPCQHGDAT